MAPVGYHPVGMKPRTMLRALLPTSTIATSLSSAFDTSSVRPSDDSASELGVDVAGAFGDRLIEICSIASRDIVSCTHTVELFADATNRRPPSFDSTIAFGCS